MVEKAWDMHKRAFQTLKRTLMHVSGLSPPYSDKKNWFIKYFALLSKYGEEDLKHAKMCVSGPETLVYACLRSSPPYFDKKTKYFIN